MWRELEAFAEAYVGVPFSRAHVDCFMFSARWVRRITGVDIRANGVARYRSQAEAFRRVREAGFRSLEALVSHSLPVTDQPQLGDLVLMTEGAERIGSLGIFIDSETALTVSPALGLCFSGAEHHRVWSCHGQ